MSKERDRYGFSDAFRMAAIAFLGIVTSFYPENTQPGEWAAEKKRRLKGR